VTLRREGRLPPIQADAFLVWPRGGNTGDQLIADASERYLRDRGINVWRSDGSIEEAALEGETAYLRDLFGAFRGMVMFAGGGNIGIYADNGQVRAAVIASAGPRHRLLVLPQSAFAPEPALVDPRVTVWCRDQVSQSVLKQAGTRTALVPDIALYMDDLIPKAARGEGMFYVRRTPGGDSETIDHGISPGCESDDLTLTKPLSHVIDRLRPYEIVISDRLHGGLIALMMGKKVVLLPVGYHKTRSFHDTWFRSNPGALFCDRAEELAARIKALRRPEGDLKALFCEHADPALNRFLLDA
jgi:exopolysaccharide biosynthesis predicted pyruvyltransferase EpsI